MKVAFLEGKTQTEKNKIIAAAVLGLVALVALYFAFGSSLFGSSSTTTAKASPTPRPSVTPRNVDEVRMPTVSEQDFVYQTIPINYDPNRSGAPDPGRNIFAFYEPPPPTPYSPTPIPVVTPKPMTPTPTPVYLASYINPQSVYAGSQGFRLEVNGDRFTPEAKIHFNQNEVPTTFINAQKVVTDIPANFITQEGPRQIIVQSPDGTKYSEQLMLNVQAPPRPTFQYVGMISRKRHNNDTAYFTEGGRPTPFGARLNDVVGGRFRLINITSAEVTFQDVDLGFKHRLPIAKGASGSGSTILTTRPGFDPATGIPGVPSNVPRYVPPQPQPKRTPSKDDEDVDDNDDGDGL